jgi:tRNA threonylcarbamoyladenosine modification (KEOPS) complex  Pcc1 subunit
MKAHATVRLDFHSEKQLTTVLNALEPEAKRPTVTRSRVRLEKDGTFLVIAIDATDTTALRAALNSYLRWVNSLENIIKLLQDKK